VVDGGGVGVTEREEIRLGHKAVVNGTKMVDGADF